MDKTEFEKTYDRNGKRLYLIALSFTANPFDSEDILQNVFMKLWRTNTVFESDEHMDKWLTSVAVNECKNLLKRAFRKNTVSFDNFSETYFFETENYEDLFNAVMSLPPKMRTVIHLYYYEDMPISEISKMLGAKESAVKTRLHRAREQIKNILGDDWNDK